MDVTRRTLGTEGPDPRARFQAGAAEPPSRAKRVVSRVSALIAACVGALVAVPLLGAPAALADVASGDSIEAFHSRDFVGISGYPANTPLTVWVARGAQTPGVDRGVILAKVTRETDDAGAIEINHDGGTPANPGDCFEGGIAPDIQPGDMIYVSNDPNDPLGGTINDFIRVQNLTMTWEEDPATGNGILSGVALDWDTGEALPEIAAQLRNGADRPEATVTPDPATGAFTVESWDVGENGTLDGPVQFDRYPDASVEYGQGGGAEFSELTVAENATGLCTPAPENRITSSPFIVNAAHTGSVVVTGVLTGGATVTNVTGGGALAQDANSFTVTFDAAQVAALPEGTTEVVVTFSTGLTTKTTIAKDTLLPLAPSATPPAGTYGGRQDVTLNKPAGEGTSKIVYETRTPPELTPDPDQFSNLYSTQIGVTATQTIKARVMDAAGNLGAVAELAYKIGTAPGIPAGVTATEARAGVRISWTAVAGATGYNVYKVVVGAPVPALVNLTPVAATSVTDSGLANGDYTYFVRAVEGNGIESADSTRVTATVGPPPVPSGLRATEGDARITLNWTANGADTANYRVYRDGVALTPLVGGTQTSFVNTGLTNGTTYTYAIAALDALGNASEQSGIVQATPAVPADVTAPSVPTGVRGAAVDATTIDVTWTASTDAVGVTGYEVYRDTDTTTPIATVTTGTTYRDTVAAASSHTYRVRAVDAAGNKSGLSTASASVTTPAAPDTEAPSVPNGVTATAVSSSSIRVDWTASTDNVRVAGYKVFRDGGATAIATVTNGTTFTDSGLAASSTHTYTVSAVDAATPTPNQSAKSSASAPVTTPAAADTTAPSVPTNVAGTATSSSTIVVSWSPSTDASGVAGYKVFRDGGTTAVGTVTNGTTFTDTGLAASSSHTYTVSAYDTATPANESAKSAASASVTTQAGTNPGTAGIALHGSSFSANATATTLVIPKPAGAVSGDVAVMAIAARGNPTITPAAGWTLVRTDTNSTTMRQAVYRKVLGASEPASYTWTLSSSQAAAGGIMAYGGVDTVTPVNVHGGQFNASSTSVTAPSITTTRANAQLVGFFGTAAATTFTAPTGMTERGDIGSTAGTFRVTLEGADVSRSATGATGTQAARSAAGAANIGQLVALAPSGGTTTPPPNDTQAPTVPTGVTGTATSSSSIRISWTASSDNVGVAGYRVYRDGGTTPIATVTSGTSYNDTGLAASSTHTYVVEAYDAAGNKATSTPSASVTTQAGTANPAPAGIAQRGSSFAANATATTLVIPKPAAAQANDVAVMAIAARGNPTITAPAGWTLVRTDTNSTTMRQAVYRKVLGATEPASYTWTLSSSQAAAGGIQVYSGVSTVTPVDVHGGQFNASSTSVTAPSITTTRANAQLVGFFGTAAATTFTAPTGMTERGDVASAAGTFKVTLEGADAGRATAGATGTQVARSAAAAANIGQVVALGP